MNTRYNTLSILNGYYRIGCKEQILLIYIAPNSFPKIDFSTINIADHNNFELELEVVDDYELHKTSNAKKGSYKKVVNIKDLGDFSIYR